MVKKFFIRSSIFIIILISILSVLNPIFILKGGYTSKIAQGVYEHTGKSYDILLLGSSHMNSSINPNVLWNKYGITSFNYGTGGQPIDVTYYLLKEILKNHDNRNIIVVIDLYYLGLTEEFGEEEYIRYVLDSMKFSKNKLEAIMSCTPRDQWIYYLFPIMKYHDRWKELSKTDFNFDTKESYYKKGFAAGQEVYGKKNLSEFTTETAEIPPKSAEYLSKIIELSQKAGFKLLFINAPHDYTSTAGMKSWHNEPAKMFNKVTEIAQYNDIPFINFNNIYNELDFDFKSDMFNNGHMNIWGSNKVSTYFGKFLEENYALIDHRKDESYADWNSDYLYYEKAESAATLK